MCGDFEEALELAVGAPRSPDRPEPDRPWLRDLDQTAPSPEEVAEYDRQEEARRIRIDRVPLMSMAWNYSRLSHEWLTARDAHVRLPTDPLLREALDIVAWDSSFIVVKVGRALDGLDRYNHGEERDEDPVQSDWNGSAKVAIISIERSEAAWRLVADASGDPEAASLADLARMMRHAVYQQFPRVMAFVRPGFDEPWR